MTPAALLLLALRQGVLLANPPSAPTCMERQRIELSRPPPPGGREICIRPGVLTGLLFDVPVSVDLQDEVRFEEILRSGRGIGVIPPPDLIPGERLRLTVRFSSEREPSSVTFPLVFHPGAVTRQVDVFHDDRSRDALVREVEEEHAKNQRLREENQSLREQLQRPLGLRQLILGGALDPNGIQVRVLLAPTHEPFDEPLSILSGVSYRAADQVAVDLVLRNNGTERWTLSAVALREDTGDPLRNVDFVQPPPLEPQGIQHLFVEGTLARNASLGALSLSIEDEEGRTITLPPIPLPGREDHLDDRVRAH
ncbi:DUF2381 family protein [Melittangium boletus]|uniref:DUF2381 family protein n=1 Tax=Melittangium boletus DSM 14713 TaxID=1294270 RepID=A0A250I6B2_9BACT|nr:DUF2381 family protein [Melittangium boletus]ATB27394.1 hypothetical protein MEBOL_000832 [Melittangium boletus DSM 14713]